MLTDDSKAWFEDILNAIAEIEEFLPEKRDFFEYQRDKKTRRAVERNLEIIGEAVSRILRESPEIQITDARKIVDMRNRIIHGYDAVSDENVWSIVQKHLPVLKVEILKLVI